MTECTTDPAQVTFSFFGPQKVTAAFDDGAVTSNAGLALLAQLDQRIGLSRRIAGVLGDERSAERVTHSIEDLVRQRILQIACGYEDASDANQLRTDPLLKAACGRHPTRDADLASQPTFSRLENSAEEVDILQLGHALMDQYLARRKHWHAPREVVLDVDPTDDPTHGQQEFAEFHGFYDQYMYHPVLVFDGRTGELMAAKLRHGRAVASEGVILVLMRVIHALRRKWPGVRIVLRADSGFGNQAIYDFCEKHGLEYVTGMTPNTRLKAMAEALSGQAKAQFEATGKKAKLFEAGTYQAKTWPCERRLVIKSEYDGMGANNRFVVTSLKGNPADIYRFYCGRGEAENRIKDLKNGLRADRLSCHRFRANEIRLLLHCAAYVLLWELRRRLAGTELRRAQFDTIRLRLLKIGARVVVSARRIWLHMTRHCPDQETWRAVAAQLCA